MCYSALVRKDMEKIARDFGARFDPDSFLQLYELREKLPGVKIAAGMDEFFIGHTSLQAKKIRALIANFEKLETERRRRELSDLTAELKELEARLKVKMTKTHQKSYDAKTRKIEKLLAQAKRAVSKNASEQDAYRIYPLSFAPVIQVEDKQRWLRPMRYRVLPSTGIEIPSAYNVFNARRDSLFEAKTWRALFGKKHAIFPFQSFFEWVETKDGKKQELYFQPDGYEAMWAASLYEEFKGPAGLLRSFAMVTDEPPPEVAAAGHDRCPIFLSEELLGEWLAPQGKDPKALEALLDHKQKTYYSHRMAA